MRKVAIVLSLGLLLSACPKNFTVAKLGDTIYLQTKRVVIAVFMIYDPMADKIADKRVAGVIPDNDWSKITALDAKIVAKHNFLVASLKTYETARANGIPKQFDFQTLLGLSMQLWDLYEAGKELFEAYGVTAPTTRLSSHTNLAPIITVTQKVEEREAA